MNNYGKNIRNWMGKLGVGFMQLQAKTGMSKSTLSDILNSKYEPKASILELIAGGLGVSPHYLFYDPFKTEDTINENQSVPIRSIPILTVAQAGLAPAFWFDNKIKTIDVPNTKHLKAPFIATVEGDSMKEYLLQGDKILCSDQPEKIKKKKLVMVAFKSAPDTSENSIKLITWSGNKDLHRLTEDEVITLYSINTKYDPTNYKLNEIHKIYKVVRLVEREIR